MTFLKNSSHKSHPEKLALSTSVCYCVHLHHQHTVAYMGWWGACGADADIFRHSWLKVLQCLCCACVASTCVFSSTRDLLRALLPSTTLDLLIGNSVVQIDDPVGEIDDPVGGMNDLLPLILSFTISWHKHSSSFSIMTASCFVFCNLKYIKNTRAVLL